MALNEPTIPTEPTFERPRPKEPRSRRIVTPYQRIFESDSDDTGDQLELGEASESQSMSAKDCVSSPWF